MRLVAAKDRVKANVFAAVGVPSSPTQKADQDREDGEFSGMGRSTKSLRDSGGEAWLRRINQDGDRR
jgi:hypothetical protein